MSRGLAIDCSFGGFSVAVGGKQGMLAEHHPDVHASAGLIGCIDRLLSQDGCELKDLDFLACGIGPGNFTGIRTACGAVQGFSYVHDTPIAGIVSTHALAHASGCQQAVVAYRAHRDHCYLASYTTVDGSLQEQDAPALHALGELPQLEGAWELCLHANLQDERERFAEAVVGEARQIDCHTGSLAEAVLELGLQAKERDELLGARALKPLYVRNKVALTKAEYQQGMRL